MSFRKDDELIRMAFGEMSEAEKRAADARVAQDARKQAAAEEYAAMARSLNLLKEVPPDQMSKERLREAILQRGLNQESVPSRRSWVWMPVAAFGLALAVTWSMNAMRPKAEPMIVQTKPDVESPISANLVRRNAPTVQKPVDVIKPVLVAQTAAEPVARPVRKRRNQTLLASRNAQREEHVPALGEQPAPVPQQVSAQPVSMDQPAKELGPSGSVSEPIVLISETVNAPAKATEMEAVSGVLVGG